MKKFLTLLLVAAMVFTMVGCGSNGGGEDAESGSDEETIKIGFFAPVSAPAASADGQSSLNSGSPPK